MLFCLPMYTSTSSWRHLQYITNSRRQQLAEEVPGLYIRRLTLEDPKTARERPDSGLQLPARHVCHPRASYVPSERPTSSYKSWLEEIRRERQAVLTITSLQLPDCPVPLIDYQANKRCRSASNRDCEQEESLNEIFAKLAEAKAQSAKPRESDEKSVEEIGESIVGNDGIERCCQENESFQETSSEPPTDDPSTDREDNELGAEGDSARSDCACSDLSERLRINIRKKTEVTRSCSRSPSPEVTHTIRIAMKYHGQRVDASTATGRQRPGGRSAGRPKEGPSLEDEVERRGGAACCPGVSVALDFTLNCNSVQLTARDVTVRSISSVPAPSDGSLGPGPD